MLLRVRCWQRGTETCSSMNCRLIDNKTWHWVTILLVTGTWSSKCVCAWLYMWESSQIWRCDAGLANTAGLYAGCSRSTMRFRWGVEVVTRIVISMVVIPKGQPVIDISLENETILWLSDTKLIQTQRLINSTMCNMLWPRGFDLLAYICLATCNRIPDQKWYITLSWMLNKWHGQSHSM
jgi:hypothetical protein